MTIEISTESRKVEVATKKQARRMICATSLSMQLTRKELKEFKEVQRLASHFLIDTDEILIVENPNESDREQGFVNLYFFKEEKQ